MRHLYIIGLALFFAGVALAIGGVDLMAAGIVGGLGLLILACMPEPTDPCPGCGFPRGHSSGCARRYQRDGGRS